MPGKLPEKTLRDLRKSTATASAFDPWTMYQLRNAKLLNSPEISRPNTPLMADDPGSFGPGELPEGAQPIAPREPPKYLWGDIGGVPITQPPPIERADLPPERSLPEKVVARLADIVGSHKRQGQIDSEKRIREDYSKWEKEQIAHAEKVKAEDKAFAASLRKKMIDASRMSGDSNRAMYQMINSRSGYSGSHLPPDLAQEIGAGSDNMFWDKSQLTEEENAFLKRKTQDAWDQHMLLRESRVL